MNRNEEYTAIMSDLDDMPTQMQYTVQRASARLSAVRRRRRMFTIPVGSLVSLFAVFVILVNVSTPFALACGRVPILKELVKAVAFSPSLSAAVENEYVQPVELTLEDGGVTLKIEYLIVDQKQLNVFYSLSSDSDIVLELRPTILDENGGQTHGYAMSYGGYGFTTEGELSSFTVDFFDNDIPPDMFFSFEIIGHESATRDEPVSIDSGESKEETEGARNVVANFELSLTFDPEFTESGRVIDVYQTFEIDGQKLELTTAEVYPTHIRLNFDAADSNTAWLKGLYFFLEDESGTRFEAIGNGITATGDEHTPMMKSFRLESPYFYESEQLTLYVTGAEWLLKDKEKLRLDLISESADWLPEGVSNLKVERRSSSVVLSFACEYKNGEQMYNPFFGTCYDEAGNDYYSESSSTISEYTYFDEETGEHVTVPGVFEYRMSVDGYDGDTLILTAAFSGVTLLDEPIEIDVE